MKKTALIYTGVTAALGVVGAALHSIRMNTILDPDSGLALRMAPISVCLAAVSVLSMVIVFALTFLVKGRQVEPLYYAAFYARTPAVFFISAATCALMLFGAFLCLQNGIGTRSSEMLVRMLAVFAALSGISWCIMQLMAYKKKSGAETMLCSFVMVLFLCLWLIAYYQEKAAETAMVSYVYDFLALCAAAVASYYAAGYAFGRSRPRATLFFSMAAAFFCLTAMPMAMTPAFCVFFTVTAVQQLVTVFLLVNNLEYPAESGGEYADEEYQKYEAYDEYDIYVDGDHTEE